jgi:LysR family glycine cleavage system transcriptional activator
MLRRLPPLNALKAFEAAARHESFTRAADELCVTQGAVSHQVKALETELGIKLFNRERQRLIITEPGREYLAVLRDALDRIALGTERLVQRQRSGVLTVSTSPDFAAKWLVNRLGRFAEAHPDVDLRISATMHHVDFAREEVDIAVRHGDGNWPGLEAVRLFSEQLFAVCSPKLLSGPRRIRQPADLLRYALLHFDDRKDWSRWLEAAGLADAKPVHGPVLNRASMLIDAAIDGQGIALARTTLAATDLISGRLVRPFGTALPVSKSYWIVAPKATWALPKISTFRDWLLAEAAEDARRLDKLFDKARLGHARRRSPATIGNTPVHVLRQGST